MKRTAIFNDGGTKTDSGADTTVKTTETTTEVSSGGDKE